MTRIYEALENANRDRAPFANDPGSAPAPTAAIPKSLRDKLLSLSQRIETFVGADTGVVIEFMGAQDNEDSSRLAYETAVLAASHRSRRTLLLTAGKVRYLDRARYRLASLTWERAAALGRPIEEAIYLVENLGLSICLMVESDADLPGLLGRQEFKAGLARLREQFDLILIDAPPFTQNANGTLLSKFTDGLVLVVEAGKTRWQSIRAEMDRIEESGTEILGVIFTRQCLYIPGFIYRRL